MLMIERAGGYRMVTDTCESIAFALWVGGSCVSAGCYKRFQEPHAPEAFCLFPRRASYFKGLDGDACVRYGYAPWPWAMTMTLVVVPLTLLGVGLVRVQWGSREARIVQRWA